MLAKRNKLTINDLPKTVPDFKNSEMPKDRLTEKWLTDWIVNSLQTNTIKAGDILPRKDLIAQHLGISIGTVQNAIRYTEDKGFLQSKQKTGTLISDLKFHTNTIKKQNSKRDVTVAKIKKYMIDNGIDSVMPPANYIAKKINVSANTVRLAYLYLCDTGFLKYTSAKSGKKVLKVVSLPEKPAERSSSRLSLVEKTANDLSSYISKNMKKGDKLQTRQELAQILKISVKTVHDAVTVLETRGILLSRRGRYGTVIARMPEEAVSFQPMKERSIFAKADEAVFYRWEKIQNEIIKLIQNEFEEGMKLLPMNTLAEKFDVSTNTIRKALKMLAEKGIVDFERGRYGGTFIINIPEPNSQNVYEWLAVTPDFMKVKSDN